MTGPFGKYQEALRLEAGGIWMYLNVNAATGLRITMKASV